MLIDAHAHIDQYDDDTFHEVRRALRAHRILTLSTSVNLPSFERTLAIAERTDLVVPGFGIHPWEATQSEDALSSTLPQLDQCAFIGEIGLDYRWITDATLYPAQQRVFEFLLESARSRGMLVNIHSAGAERDVADMVKAHAIDRAIVHWYSGPDDVLLEMVDRGVFFTVGVEVLRSARIREIARLIPTSRLLTETDNPGGHHWLTGETGMPTLLSEIIEELGRIKNVPPTDLIDTVRSNFLGLVGTDPHFAPWMAQLSA